MNAERSNRLRDREWHEVLLGNGCGTLLSQCGLLCSWWGHAGTDKAADVAPGTWCGTWQLGWYHGVGGHLNPQELCSLAVPLCHSPVGFPEQKGIWALRKSIQGSVFLRIILGNELHLKENISSAEMRVSTGLWGACWGPWDVGLGLAASLSQGRSVSWAWVEPFPALLLAPSMSWGLNWDLNWDLSWDLLLALPTLRWMWGCWVSPPMGSFTPQNGDAEFFPPRAPAHPSMPQLCVSCSAGGGAEPGVAVPAAWRAALSFHCRASPAERAWLWGMPLF